MAYQPFPTRNPFKVALGLGTFSELNTTRAAPPLEVGSATYEALFEPREVRPIDPAILHLPFAREERKPAWGSSDG
jgi:hypothetical protein